MLLSLWKRFLPGMPNVSVPQYVLVRIEIEPFGRHRICRPRPGAVLNLPYDYHPLTNQGSIFSLSLGKIWIRTPLKYQGVLDETYDG